MNNFILTAGTDIADTSQITEGYLSLAEGLVCSVSAEKLEMLAIEAVRLLKKPLFFFLELPCSLTNTPDIGDGMHKNVYYLDNCTQEVCMAIIERYRHILFADGLCEYGFGSADGEEIYFRRYQNISILTHNNRSAFEEKLNKLGIERKEKVTFVADVISESNPAKLTTIESEGEDACTILENLTEVGMYYSHTAQDY